MQISFCNVTLMLRECYQLDIILRCINRLLLYCLSGNKTMDWEKLLSLKRFGDTKKRERKDQDETRLGFEVDYDRIIFSSEFRSLQEKTQVVPLSNEDFFSVSHLISKRCPPGRACHTRVTPSRCEHAKK